MKKTIVSLLLVLSLVMSMFIGISVATAESGKAEFVLITDANSVDDRGFNQFSWEGLKQYAEEHKIVCYISLEERMACGIGACLGCVCKTKEKDAHSNVCNKRICKDGPVFLSTEVEL